VINTTVTITAIGPATAPKMMSVCATSVYAARNGIIKQVKYTSVLAYYID